MMKIIKLLSLAALIMATLPALAASVRCVVKDTESNKKFSAVFHHASFSKARKEALRLAIKQCKPPGDRTARCKTVYECDKIKVSAQKENFRMLCHSRNTRSNQFFNAAAEAETPGKAKDIAKQYAYEKCLTMSIGWRENCEPYQCKQQGGRGWLHSKVKRYLKGTL